MKKLSYENVKKFIENEGYELVSEEYINSRSKLKVKCNNGHIYDVKYNVFYNGKRCPICNGGIKYSYEYIKKKIENEGYELISKEYKNARSKLKFKCDKGHEYETTYCVFERGHRCPICCGKQKHSYKFIKEQIEKEEGYELISKEYKNSWNKLKIKCSKNHIYKVRWNDFKKGIRCQKCSNRISNTEKEIADYIKSLNVNVIENDRELIKPNELDIIIPEKKIAIEYCGVYWHSEIYKDKNYHLNKLEKCNEKNYRLITIFEDEWIYKQDIVKNRLKYILGLETNKIYARKCEIKEIEIKEARDFINKYHIQGYSNCKVKLGAFYNNKLVSVMTFSNASKRNGNRNAYELNRFCSSINVIGIASKLLKFFQRNYEYKKIITFADRRWSEGKLYEKIGFKKIYNVPLNYFYINGNERIHRFNFRKNVLEDKLEKFNPKLSEHQNMLNNKWYRIYDCGNIKYEMN